MLIDGLTSSNEFIDDMKQKMYDSSTSYHIKYDIAAYEEVISDISTSTYDCILVPFCEPVTSLFEEITDEQYSLFE